MSAGPDIGTHDVQCWRRHDDCALAQAKAVLVADQSTAVKRGLLATVQYGIDDHATGGCPAHRDCVAAATARSVLR